MTVKPQALKKDVTIDFTIEYPLGGPSRRMGVAYPRSAKPTAANKSALVILIVRRAPDDITYSLIIAVRSSFGRASSS
jgi:hypothetical protein